MSSQNAKVLSTISVNVSLCDACLTGVSCAPPWIMLQPARTILIVAGLSIPA